MKIETEAGKNDFYFCSFFSNAVQHSGFSIIKTTPYVRGEGFSFQMYYPKNILYKSPLDSQENVSYVILVSIVRYAETVKIDVTKHGLTEDYQHEEQEEIKNYDQRISKFIKPISCQDIFSFDTESKQIFNHAKKEVVLTGLISILLGYHLAPTYHFKGFPFRQRKWLLHSRERVLLFFEVCLICMLKCLGKELSLLKENTKLPTTIDEMSELILPPYEPRLENNPSSKVITFHGYSVPLSVFITSSFLTIYTFLVGEDYRNFFFYPPVFIILTWFLNEIVPRLLLFFICDIRKNIMRNSAFPKKFLGVYF
jgi:hypothetical protein